MTEKLSTVEFKKRVFDFEAHESWKFEGDLPVIVEFSAEWCPPCKVLAPVLDAIAHEYAGKLRVYEVNTDEEAELAAVFGIHSVPAVLFVPQTGEPRMTVGAIPRAQVLKAMRDVMAVG